MPESLTLFLELKDKVQSVMHPIPNDVPFQKLYWIIASTDPRNIINDIGKIEIKLPVAFTKSTRNYKYIEVRHVCAELGAEYTNSFCKFHSDIVKENHFDDSFICLVNNTLVKPKRYKWNSSDKVITIWFSDMANTPINPNSYVIDILLHY
jgi:hypothetical protein